VIPGRPGGGSHRGRLPLRSPRPRAPAPRAPAQAGDQGVRGQCYWLAVHPRHIPAGSVSARALHAARAQRAQPAVIVDRDDERVRTAPLHADGRKWTPVGAGQGPLDRCGPDGELLAGRNHHRGRGDLHPGHRHRRIRARQEARILAGANRSDRDQRQELSHCCFAPPPAGVSGCRHLPFSSISGSSRAIHGVAPGAVCGPLAAAHGRKRMFIPKVPPPASQGRPRSA
jgi:hypothetical protein